RAGYQPQDRQGARPDDPALSAGSGRRNYRVMDRRAFVAATAAYLVAPVIVEAQPPRLYRVGVVLQGDPYYPAVDGLRDGLRELGFEEGKQVAFSVRDAKGNLKTVEAAARSLEGEKVDLIYAVCHLGDVCGQASDKPRPDRILCRDRSR